MIVKATVLNDPLAIRRIVKCSSGDSRSAPTPSFAIVPHRAVKAAAAGIENPVATTLSATAPDRRRAGFRHFQHMTVEVEDNGSIDVEGAADVDIR